MYHHPFLLFGFEKVFRTLGCPEHQSYGKYADYYWTGRRFTKFTLLVIGASTSVQPVKFFPS